MPRVRDGTPGCAALRADEQPPYVQDPRAHPGLRAIALVEGSKALLALLAGSGLELLGPAPLRRWVHALIARFQLDPHEGALAWLARAISRDSVHIAAAAVAAYGILHVAEAWGLWRDKAWASWLGCITAALYLPFDLDALIRHPGWISVTVLAINIVVVAVLGRDLVRRRA